MNESPTPSLASFKARVGDAPVHVGVRVLAGCFDVALYCRDPEVSFEGVVHGCSKDLSLWFRDSQLNVAMVTYEESPSCCLQWPLQGEGLPVRMVSGDWARKSGAASSGGQTALALARRSACGTLPPDCLREAPAGREHYADAAREMVADLERGEAELFGILQEDLKNWKVAVPESLPKQWCAEFEEWLKSLSLPFARRQMVDRSVRALAWHRAQREKWSRCYKRLLAPSATDLSGC